MDTTASVAEQVKASNPMTSAWVVANAGSGKTHVLVERMLRLLLAGVKPGSILCLTFTRAAAVEMSARLLERLGKWAMLPPDNLAAELESLLGAPADEKQLRESRLLFARVLDTPGELRIQTIHAFCERLLLRFPIEAGVPAQFRVLDEREARELRLLARDRLLRAVASGAGEEDGLAQAMQSLCASITDDKEFSRLLSAIDDNRQELRKLLPDIAAVERAVQEVNDRLQIAAGETAASIAERIADPGNARVDLLEAADMLQRQGGKTAVESGRRIEGFLAANSKALQNARLRKYMDVFFTKSNEPRKSLLPAALAKDREDIAKSLLAEQNRLSGLRARYMLCVSAERSCAVLRLSYRMVAGFEAEKARLGALDFDDLIEKTASLLERSEQAAWVLYKLDEGITHILIDEAQDTSPRQWNVIAALAQEFFSGKGSEQHEEAEIARSLFAVGDEKQSIFRFQGADLEIYDEMRLHFGERVNAAQKSWEEVPLQRSFRSTPEILRAVDYLFAEGDGKERVSKSGEAIAHLANREQERGLVEIWEPECSDTDTTATPDYWDIAPPLTALSAEPRALLAKRIASRIRGWLDDGVMSKSHGRALLPKDILILVQRRDGFVEEMTRALKQQGVPVAGADRMRLSEHMAVMDLLALARACLLRDDDLSLAETLKSPFFGLDDDDLFKIAHGRKKSLWQALRHHSEEDGRLKEIVERLEQLRHRATRLSPFAFYHGVLVEGGREKLLARLGLDAADPIDSFLDHIRAYERENAASLQGFLHWLKRSSVEIKRDQDSTRDEVRVMTVHGAKGLEADILFLADTCRQIGHWRHDPVLFFGKNENDVPMIWAPSPPEDVPFSANERSRLREEDRSENWRLLYVAMTRARDRLYICGHHSRMEPPEDSWYARCSRALLPHMEEITLENDEKVWRLGEEPAPPTSKTSASKGDKSIAALKFSELKPEKSVASIAPSAAFASTRERSGWQKNDKRRSARRRGEILHEALRRLSAVSQEHRSSVVEKIVAALAPEATQEEHDEYLETLGRVLASEECRALLDAEGRNEVPLSGYVCLRDEEESQRVPGRVDRLCFLPGDEVLAVEYKSDRRVPASVGELRQEYLGQVGIYYRLLRELWPERKIRCGILWMETARFMEIPKEDLEAVTKN